MWVFSKPNKITVMPNYKNEFLSPRVERLNEKRGDAAPAQTLRSTEPERCVVGGAHALLLRISSFFGLAPLRFKSCANGFTVSISSKMCLYGFILVSILILLTIYGQVNELNAGLSVLLSSKLAHVVDTCDVLVVVVIAAVGVYGAPTRMRKMLKLMDRIALVDNTLSGQYFAVTERKLSVILLAPLILFSFLIVDASCFYAMQAETVDRKWQIVTKNIGFYLLWFVVMILELQFAFTALSMRARFQVFNDVLALTARSIAGPVSGESRLLVSPSEAVYELASLHGTLCELVHRINDIYGIPLVVILISMLLHLIVSPYFIIMEIIEPANGEHFLVLKFLWCAIHLLRIFLVVEPSHYTIKEGKRTEVLVCRLMTSGPSSGLLSSRLELFSRQLMLRSVSYSPMGICTLDRPLVASILGAVTTYLVIVIQFQRN